MLFDEVASSGKSVLDMITQSTYKELFSQLLVSIIVSGRSEMDNNWNTEEDGWYYANAKSANKWYLLFKNVA